MSILGMTTLTAISAIAAIPHGSIKGTSVALYPDGGAPGGNTTETAKATTLDFKVVTKDGKSWAYTKYTGPNALDMGANWTSQLRYWSNTNAKTENNLVVSKNATTNEIMGKATAAIPSPLKISLWQAIAAPDNFSESAAMDYDVTIANSPVASDNESPVVTTCQVNALATTAVLSLTGSDNSNDLYYYISDAANNVEEFALANTCTLTNLTASTIYDLTITPIDFNGNEGTAIQTSFKTGTQRSTVANGNNMNYDSNVIPAGDGGELVAIITRNGNTLTLGCTTADAKLGGNTNRTFHPLEDAAYLPTVKINGTPYTLERTGAEAGAEGITTASITFTDNIGGIAITDGLSLDIQWSVFWSAPNNGNFFTGTFLYKVGDNGQTDTEAPAKPEMKANEGNITWAACADALSGTKQYEVTVDGGAATIILDLDEASYTLPYTKGTTVTVAAVDFAGNKSEVASYYQTSTLIASQSEEAFAANCKDGILTITGMTPVKVTISMLNGQSVEQFINLAVINVSNFTKGVYIITCTDNAGTTKSTKIIL